MSGFPRFSLPKKIAFGALYILTTLVFYGAAAAVTYGVAFVLDHVN